MTSDDGEYLTLAAWKAVRRDGPRMMSACELEDITGDLILEALERGWPGRFIRLKWCLIDVLRRRKIVKHHDTPPRPRMVSIDVAKVTPTRASAAPRFVADVLAVAPPMVEFTDAGIVECNDCLDWKARTREWWQIRTDGRVCQPCKACMHIAKRKGLK